MRSMKKYLVICLVILIIYVIGYYLYYNTGLHIDLFSKEAKTFMKSDDSKIYMFNDGEYHEFEIKGVNLGAGIPGHFATDYDITKKQYLRWFDYIKGMGANTVRVYTILGTAFYEAVYEYNYENDDPIYIMHGLWLNDYALFSYRDAYHKDILDTLERDSRAMVDVIWGNRNVNLGDAAGTGFYRKNISPWVIGYILGVDWEHLTVIYTDKKYESKKNSYKGKYMYTTESASPFEAMLARVGDGLIDYETKRYGTQRLVAFSNWPTTDPFEYNHAISYYLSKVAKVDVEHIKTTDNFIAGTFASYHVYPDYPDYLRYEKDLDKCLDLDGNVNTYYSYLKRLTDYHTIPVVISEFGLPASRGMTQRSKHTSHNQGGMSETEQADALVQCYNDIKSSGSAGSIVFSWQDEWFRRTWNTMHAIDLLNTPYWSDYQTGGQHFGLLSFDPGDDESVCYVDGDISDWKNTTPIISKDNLALSMMYDEKFVYFMVQSSGLSESDSIFIPIDTTSKSGAAYCENYDIGFDCNADFIMKINGSDNSSVLVQERYEVLRATYGEKVYGINPYLMPPEKDSTKFNPIDMILNMSAIMSKKDVANMNPYEFAKMEDILSEVHETGKLVEGIANPYKEEYNSLADFCYGTDCIEIKIPWQLLNFSNPNEMKIHDDYYENYGVESIKIDEMRVGCAINPTVDDIIATTEYELTGWGQKVTYHERLKPAYYAMQQIWIKEEDIQ